MKIYTKTGDDGTTGLFGGQRVSKTHPRVEAYGAVDELNAAIGVVSSCVDQVDRLRRMLEAIQAELFTIGAELATPDRETSSSGLRTESVERLERWIDETEAVLPRLRCFILPGGCEISGRLHFARTVCRRAERVAVALNAETPLNPNVLKYLNRLGDLLFSLARRANQEAGVEDVPWLPPERAPDGDARTEPRS